MKTGGRRGREKAWRRGLMKMEENGEAGKSEARGGRSKMGQKDGVEER